jgi:hypothetical protein
MSGTMAAYEWTNILRVCVLIALLTPCAASASPKLDVVYLGNGDRLTCEIKKLQQGGLVVNTDPIDRVTVHWGTVLAVTSPRAFEVTVESGDRYYGSLGRTAVDGVLVVTSGGSPVATVNLATVTAIVPIGGSLWRRMDGNLDLGFTFTQADLETHWTFNSGATYRSPRFLLSSSLASQLTARQDEDKTSRNTLSLSANRIVDTRWFATALGQIQQNDELALDLRSVAGGGFGRILSQSNRRSITTFAGVVYTRERFTDQPADDTAELAVGGQVNLFTPANNDFSLSNSIVTYYRAHRARVETQSAWQHEFLGDFYWSLNGVESFDSNPPDGQKRNDFSISLSIGWKF